MEAEGIHSGKRHRRDMDEPEAEAKGVGGLHSWQNASSRIIRVSRVTGGKDRHSKVWTVKGLRDRRVRLSVSTSIQFYDLQDRLGYDQPSKAVDWLIKAASAAIVDLPELEGPFPVPPSLAFPGRAIFSGEKHISHSKSTCSSASETSKSSVLPLSRCESLVKEKEKDHQNLNKESPFTEQLAAGSNSNGGAAGAAMADFSSSFDPKQLRPLPAGSTSDYFRQTQTFGQAHRIPQFEPSYSSLLHYGSNPHIATGMMPYNATASADHQDIQQFSFMQDHAIPVSTPSADANHNVSISSGIAGFTRGTLQSNSPHQHHLVHGANIANFPFFLSPTIPFATTGGSFVDNQFPGDFNARLHLFSSEAQRHTELKRERKS